MSRFNTGNPLGSGSPLDLDDNAKNLDEAANSSDAEWSDRFGQSRLTFAGAQELRNSQFQIDQVSREQRFNTFIASSGYQFLGDYGPDIEFTEYNQLVRDENGEFWRVSGQVDLPYVTTGDGIPEGDALVPAGDAVLRQDLANPSEGAGLIAYGGSTVESALGELEQFNEDLANPDKGAAMVGVYPVGILKYSLRRLNVHNFVEDRNNPDYRAAIAAMFSRYSEGYTKFDLGDEELFIGDVDTPFGQIFQFSQPDGLDIRHTGLLTVNNLMPSYNTFQSVLKLIDPRHCGVELHVKGNNYDPADPRGVAALLLMSDIRDGYDVDAKVSCDQGMSPFQTWASWDAATRGRTEADPNISNIIFESTCNTAKYGCRMFDVGENVQGTVNSVNGGRSCFLLGVENVHMNVNSSGMVRYSDCLIKAYHTSSRNIIVNLNHKDSTGQNYWPIDIEHQNDEQDTSIENVEINVKIANRTFPNINGIPVACVGRSFTRSGTVNTTTNCVTNNITLNMDIVRGIDDDFQIQPFDFPSKPNGGGLVETNVIGRGFSTNGFTLKTGRTYRASTVFSPATNPVELYFGEEFQIPSYAIMKITIQGLQSRSSLTLPGTDLIIGYYHVVFSSASDGAVTLLGDGPLVSVLNSDFNFTMKTLTGRPVLVVESTRVDETLNGMVSITAEIQTGSRMMG